MTLLVRRLPDLDTLQLTLIHDLVRDYNNEIVRLNDKLRLHSNTEADALRRAQIELKRCLP